MFSCGTTAIKLQFYTNSKILLTDMLLDRNLIWNIYEENSIKFYTNNKIIFLNKRIREKLNNFGIKKDKNEYCQEHLHDNILSLDGNLLGTRCGLQSFKYLRDSLIFNLILSNNINNLFSLSLSDDEIFGCKILTL